ncbi:MAG TPA: patatin-like phospholipase family protein [Tepidisphaeraceae bacterium]|jgi:predicted patatin/cPLA2 family phospholipase
MRSSRTAILLLAVILLGGCCPERPGADANATVVSSTTQAATTRATTLKSRRYAFQEQDLEQSVADRAERKGPGKTISVLVLSGGGSNGAWGAGFLKGWAAGGSRPTFDVVTGVSTGGLLATGAFLGDDAMLQQAFTTTSDNDVKGGRFALSVPFSDSVYTSEPLKRLIAKYVTDAMIDRVGVEAAKGRRLYVASTDLDAGRLHIWNLTAIAQARDYDFYRTALLASASAPLIFPPVEIEGVLHADGGVKANLFFRNNLLPRIAASHRHAEERLGARTRPATASTRPALAKPTVYVIVNGQLDAKVGPVKDCLIPLAQRAVDCLMDSNNVGCLYETKYWARDMRYDFRLAFIPDDVAACDSFTFDQPKMQALYATAITYGRKYAGQSKWMTIPDVDEAPGEQP